MARRKDAEASIVWVRDTQAGVEGNRKDSDYEKMHALPESDSVKPVKPGTEPIARKMYHHNPKEQLLIK